MPASKPFNSKVLPVLLFNAFYLMMAVLSAASHANYEFVIYIGVVIAVILIVIRFHFRYGLCVALLWLLSFWGFLHMAGGLVNVPLHWPTGGGSKVLYNLWLVRGWLKFDQFVHAYGFGVTTWLIWQVLQKVLAGKFGRSMDEIRPTRGLLFLCVIASMGLGALNEVVEFLATLFVPETNVGGYINTAWDLVANCIGASIAAILILLAKPPKSSVP